MQVIQNFNHIFNKSKGLILTIGNFDGIHLGHQYLFSFLQELAGERNASSAVMSFEPHSKEFFAKEDSSFFRLTSAEEKRELLADIDIDYYIELPFNQEMAMRTAENFIEDILINWLHVKAIIVGDNFYFGKGKSGDVNLLKSYADKGFFDIISPALLSDNQEVISSTRIRSLLRKGKIDDAEKLLGRKWEKNLPRSA